MRRRRRSTGTWFPIIGTTPNEGQPRSTIEVALTVPADPTSSVSGILPVTYDHPQENDLQADFETLSEIVGSEYFLKRIVGNIFVSPGWLWNSDLPDNTAINLQVFAGFFVARADSGQPTVPVGLNITDNYRVNAPNNIREPWIWRRSWLLGNPGYQQFQNQGGGAFSLTGQAWYPPSNAHYGSVAEGTKIDQKTKRRVSSDDRLWMAFTARTAAPAGILPENATNVYINADLRVFADLRKPRNRGVF